MQAYERAHKQNIYVFWCPPDDHDGGDLFFFFFWGGGGW